MGKDLVHVLLVSFPAQGHINPLLRLARLLASKGLLVTFSTTEAIAHRMQKATNTFASSDGPPTVVGDGQLRFDFFSDGWAIDDSQRDDIIALMDHLKSVCPTTFADLIKRQAVQGRPVTHVINNPFLPWALDVAAEMGIPCGVLWVQSCAVFSTYYHYFHKLAKFPTPSEPSIDVQLPSMPLLTTDDLPSFLLPDTPYSCLTDAILGQFKNISKASWVLVESFEELEPGILQSLSSHVSLLTIGPLFKWLQQEAADFVRGDIWKAADCVEWLDSQQPSSVVYVSFGSVIELSQEQMEEIAWGLRNSRRPFLWVVRGWDDPSQAKLPKGYLEEIEGQGKVVQWSPQDLVLAHPAMGCFMTHCGWNSSMEAICCGVPVITFPQWGDQVTNAKFMTDVYGIGLRLGFREGGPLVKREDMEKCVEEIMGEGPKAKEIRSRCLTWKETAEKAVGHGGSSHVNVQTVMDDVRRSAGELNPPIENSH
ncbi:hypothetical protein ACLOJK_003760 [Asimina triloba]